MAQCQALCRLSKEVSSIAPTEMSGIAQDLARECSILHRHCTDLVRKCPGDSLRGNLSGDILGGLLGVCLGDNLGRDFV